jgi:hypothetical protein
VREDELAEPLFCKEILYQISDRKEIGIGKRRIERSRVERP